MGGEGPHVGMKGDDLVARHAGAVASSRLDAEKARSGA
jgi:hypothetical protein